MIRSLVQKLYPLEKSVSFQTVPIWLHHTVIFKYKICKSINHLERQNKDVRRKKIENRSINKIYLAWETGLVACFSPEQLGLGPDFRHPPLQVRGHWNNKKLVEFFQFLFLFCFYPFFCIRIDVDLLRVCIHIHMQYYIMLQYHHIDAGVGQLTVFCLFFYCLIIFKIVIFKYLIISKIVIFKHFIIFKNF